VPFPDLGSPSDTARGTLVKIGIRRDPDGKTNDDLLYDLQLAYLPNVNDPADAQRLDAAVPGVAALLAGGPSTRRTIADTSDVPDRWLTVQDPVTGIYRCWQRRCSFEKTQLRLVGTTVTAIVTARVRGLDPTDASNLARLLEREIDVTFEDLQPSLGLGAPRPVGGGVAAQTTAAIPGRPLPNHRGWDGSVGCIVAGKYQRHDGTKISFAGMVVSADAQPDGTLLVVEDVLADQTVRMPHSEVSSTIHVVAPPGPDTLTDILARYASFSASKNAPASWNYIVTAFGMSYASGGVIGGPAGEWVLTPEIAHAAVDLAMEEAESGGPASGRQAAEA
jgi:hypothetical protein